MEIWKDIVDYPDLFEVSSNARIRNKKTKKVLKQWLHPHGYYHIATKIGGRGGKSICFKVHREVAKAFIPNPENKPSVNHINCIKTDNVPSNLEWVTPKENSTHALENDLVKNTSISLRKLSNPQVEFVRSNYKSRDKEFGCRALAKKYSVSHRTISEIVNNQSYKTEA